MEHPLKINKELRDAKMIDVDTPLPEYTRGGYLGILVGLQDVSLDPILIGMLPSGLGVYQCPFVDIWGSSIAYAGPHPSFRAPHIEEFGVSLMIEGVEGLSRPEKSRRRKRWSRRRPCLCLWSPAGWGGDNQGSHRHRHRHQHQ